MSLRSNLESALSQKLTAWNQQPGTISVQNLSGNLTLELDYEKIETLGCLIKELRFKCQTNKTSYTDLEDWSKKLSSRVTYLLETLGALEFDPQAGQALIRSAKPASNQHIISYYEILLELSQSGYLTLRRYENNRQIQQRTLVPLCLTREVLSRLADDLTDTAPIP